MFFLRNSEEISKSFHASLLPFWKLLFFFPDKLVKLIIHNLEW